MVTDDVSQFFTDVADGEYGYESAHGIVRSRELIDGETTVFTGEAWECPPDRSRLDKFQSVDGDETDSRDVSSSVVRNGDEMVVYDRQADEYRRQQLDARSDSPAVVSRSRIIQSVIEGSFESTVHGRTTVPGHEACELTVTPTVDVDGVAGGVTELRLWVNTRHRFPLRYNVAYKSGRRRINKEFEWETAEFNVEIQSDTFDISCLIDSVGQEA